MKKEFISIYLLFVVILACFGVLSAGTETPAADPVRKLIENYLLLAETELSKSGGVYFIFNFNENKILLKCRGMLMREWNIEKYLFWGDPVPFTPEPLIKRSTLKPPKRENIKPGDKDGNIKLDVLEVTDMPLNYDLYFNNNIRVEVKNKPEKLLSKIHRLWKTWDWYTFSPLETLLYRYKKQSFTHIRLWLENIESTQSLFWTMLEKTPCLFILPESLMTPPPAAIPSSHVPSSQRR